MKNNILLIMFLGIFLFSMSGAYAISEDGFMGTGKQGNVFNISQVCNEATYITITAIQYPDRTIIEQINKNMTMIGQGTFYYNFNNTLQLGRYDVLGVSDGCELTFASYFNITPSGNSGSSNTVFFIFIVLIIYTITFVGFFGKNAPITILGGMCMMLLGIYTINNGIIIYRDVITNYFSYITIAIGAIFTFWAIIEYLDI